MSGAVHLDDLAVPRLSDLQRAALDDARAHPTPIDVSAMHAAARVATGLDDFGPDDYLVRWSSGQKRSAAILRSRRTAGGSSSPAAPGSS